MAEGDDWEVGEVDLQDGDVRIRVAANDLGRRTAAIPQNHLDCIGFGNHVPVCEDVTLLADDDTGTQAGFQALVRWC